MSFTYTSPLPAASVMLIHHYENGAIVATDAVKRPGRAERQSGFYEGAWLRQDGSVFFMMDSGQVVEAASPGELVNAVMALRARLARRAA